MINIAIMMAALYCAPTTVINRSGLVWSVDDDNSVVVATKRCPQLYPEAPCLGIFVKVDKNVYRAICGKKSEVE